MNSAKWTYFTEDRVLCCRACRDSASSLITLAIAGQWSAMQALYLSELLTSPWASSTEAKQSVMTRQVFFECILCFSVKPSHLQPITNIAPWEKKQHSIQYVFLINLFKYESVLENFISKVNLAKTTTTTNEKTNKQNSEEKIKHKHTECWWQI